MALLPPSMQDKTEFMPLGKAIQKPEPVKADPVREFEKHNHDIPGAKLPRVTPEMASRALRSLCVGEWTAEQKKKERKEAFDRISKQYEASINREYPELWEGLFQKQAAKQAERLDKLSELSKPPALTWPTLPDLLVLEVERRLAAYDFARINIDDMNAIVEWFGPLGIPDNWLGKVSYSSEFQRMAI